MVVTSQTFSLLPLVVKIEYFTSNMSIQGKYKLGDGVGGQQSTKIFTK